MWECLGLFRLKSFGYFGSFLIIARLLGWDVCSFLGWICFYCTQEFKVEGGKWNSSVFSLISCFWYYFIFSVALPHFHSLPSHTHIYTAHVLHLSFVSPPAALQTSPLQTNPKQLVQRQCRGEGRGWAGRRPRLGCILLGFGVLKRGVAWSQ